MLLTNPTKAKSLCGNLHLCTSESDLKKLIQSVGAKDIVEVKMLKDDGQSKGYATVHLQSEASKKTIMEKLSRTKFHDKSLRFNITRKTRENLRRCTILYPMTIIQY